MEPVACVHAPLGCSHVAPRSVIVLHEQDIAQHFSAVCSKAFAEQQQFYQQQTIEMKQMLEQKLHIFETKLEEQMMLFNSRLEEQTEERLERQTTTFTRQQKTQLSFVKESLEGIELSLQPLVEKAEAEAKAAALAAEKATTLAEAKRKQQAKMGRLY